LTPWAWKEGKEKLNAGKGNHFRGVWFQTIKKNNGAKENRNNDAHTEKLKVAGVGNKLYHPLDSRRWSKQGCDARKATKRTVGTFNKKGRSQGKRDWWKTEGGKRGGNLGGCRTSTRAKKRKPLPVRGATGRKTRVFKNQKRKRQTSKKGKRNSKKSQQSGGNMEKGGCYGAKL